MSATTGYRQHNGDTITVTGRIYAGNYLKNVITKPTFLNVYDSSPMHMLMVRIDSGDRKNFPIEPEKYYHNKMVSITGVISDYKGVSLIKISNPAMVNVDMSDPGPQPITNTGSYMSGEEFGFGKADSVFRKSQDSVRAVLAADPSRKKALKLQMAKPVIPVRPAADTVKINPAPTPPAETKKTPPVVEVTTPAPRVEASPPAPPVEAEKAVADNSQKPIETPEKIEETLTNKTAEKKTAEIKTESSQDDIITEDNKPETGIRVQGYRRTPRVINAPKPVTKPMSDRKADSVILAKTTWLKTISNQDFEPVVNETKIVKDGEIEMRTSPNMDAPVIAYLMKQMTIHITHRSKKWSYVTVENPDGTIGLSGFIKNKTYKDLMEK